MLILASMLGLAGVRLSSGAQGGRSAGGTREEVVEERKGGCICATSVGHT
jgi:hypothetical protein